MFSARVTRDVPSIGYDFYQMDASYCHASKGCDLKSERTGAESYRCTDLNRVILH